LQAIEEAFTGAAPPSLARRHRRRSAAATAR